MNSSPEANAVQEQAQAAQPVPQNGDVAAPSQSQLANIVEAVMGTLAHPDIPSVLNDVCLVMNLVAKVKELNNGNLHPTAIQVLKSLL